jgi:hypothetical protein
MRLRKLSVYIFFFICLFVVVLSCKKVLDTQPEFSINGSTAFNKISDFENTLTGAYRLFANTNYYGSTDAASNAFAALPDMLADNLDETSESLGNERVFSRWVYAADEPQIENTWLAGYSIIAQANLIPSKGIDKFSSADPGAVNRIKAQALAIRALVHFDLLRYWAEEYDRNSTKPGVPYITEFNYEAKPSRGTVKEDYDHIEADLLAAKDLMSDMDRPINSSGSRAYIDSSAVNALLARVYLYANQLDNAIKYASYAINARPLASRASFPNIWTDASVAEVFWSYTFESGQGGPGTNAYAPNVNRSQYRPNPTLVSTYDQPNDIRFSSYFQVIAKGSGSRRVLSKYIAKAAQLTKPDGVTNFKAFRTGEMYLIRAEAYARSGNDLSAMDDLNTLRAARIAGYVPEVLTGTALLDAIALERRKELIAEGHRFFDLKRTTHVINKANCAAFCTLETDDRAWNWPIPQAEIDANPNILPQNPGY